MPDPTPSCRSQYIARDAEGVAAAALRIPRQRALPSPDDDEGLRKRVGSILAIVESTLEVGEQVGHERPHLDLEGHGPDDGHSVTAE